MGKTIKEREGLMAQMRTYRKRLAPFDVSFRINESPQIWWSSIEDCFNKDEDYICQLALKLFAITPHAAGCERIWSKLGWYYGKRRVRLSLHKLENMQKLAAFYLSNTKKNCIIMVMEKRLQNCKKLFKMLKYLKMMIMNFYKKQEMILKMNNLIMQKKKISEIENLINLDAEEITS